MELPQVQALLERTIYHSLRKTTVAAGYLPDILQYDVENPDNSTAISEKNRYMADLKNIANEKGFAIELFNNGPSQQKGTLRVPRIVLETEAFYPGEIGLDTTGDYQELEDGSYDYYRNPFLTQTSDMYFNIRLIANTVAQERVLNGILLSTLPRRGYMKWDDEEELLPSQNIFIHWAGHSQDLLENQGITEKSHRYYIGDLQELDLQLLKNVPAITDIGNLNIDIEND